MRITIRCAVAVDLPRMRTLARHAASAAQWTDQQYEQLFAAESRRRVLVLEEAGQVKGFLVAQPIAGEWELENVAVAADARRRGLGTRLLGEFLDQARAAGATAVFLEVRESNQAARALYEKWAFVESGRRKAYYRDPTEDALVFRFSFSGDV
jgi:[ribosomal protein S18]-alanine N-acetyltransferase